MSQLSQYSQPDTVILNQVHVPRRKNKKSNPIREIRAQQNKTGLVIPAAPFRRLVDELTDELTEDTDIRYQQEAVEALQVSAEAYLIDIFKKANKLAIYKGRETLHNVDISLAHNL